MKPLVDVAPGTERKKSELRVTGENGKSRQNYLVMFVFVSWARRKNKTGVELFRALAA